MSASIEQRFRAGVLADATVSSFVGSRMYFMQLPENAQYPCLRYQKISDVPIYTQQLAGTQASTGWARFQIDVLVQGKNVLYSGQIAINIALAIRNALQTFNLSQQPESPTVLRQAPNYLLMERGMVEGNTQPPLFVQRLDVRSFYEE